MEEFMQLAPEEARTEEVLTDEHQLMLNRLSFELSERQRYATTHFVMPRRKIHAMTSPGWISGVKS